MCFSLYSLGGFLLFFFSFAVHGGCIWVWTVMNEAEDKRQLYIMKEFTGFGVVRFEFPLAFDRGL